MILIFEKDGQGQEVAETGTLPKLAASAKAALRQRGRSRILVELSVGQPRADSTRRSAHGQAVEDGASGSDLSRHEPR
jgi:hypothetical protein